MLILGIDPGTNRIGYGLIEKRGDKFRTIDYGCIEISQKSTPKKLLEISKKLQKILKKHQPKILAVEKLFFTKNVKTAISVSEARGVIILEALKNNLKIVELTPLQVKIALTGYGKAPKTQIAQMVKLSLGLKKIPKPDDTTDALAIAITGNFYQNKLI